MANEKPAGGKRRTYHHGGLRDQLLEEVRALIEAHGPDGFSVAEAARRAGVSTAAPYRHFRDRGEILHGVSVKAMQRLYVRMVEGSERFPAGDPDRVIALGRAYVRFAREEPEVFRLCFGLADATEDETLTELGDGAIALVARVVGEHMNRDPADAEVQTRAYALWCVVHGHCFLMLDAKVDAGAPFAAEDRLLPLVGAAIVPPGR